MDNGMIAVAEAIGTLGKENTQVEITTATQLVTELLSYVPLTQKFSALLGTDEQTYFAATLEIGTNNPQQAAVAAADYATYLTDSGKMTHETGMVSSSIQNEKAQVRTEGSNMGQVFSLSSPLQGIESLGVALLQTPF